MQSGRRSFFVIPIFLTLCALMGGLAGPGASGVEAASSEDEIKASLQSFAKVYDLVERNFADKVAADKALYKGAIPGMLRTLDPHSSFLDSRDFQLMREEQKGHYYGVGMTVAPRNSKTIVIAPFPGSPAYRAGIRPGDVIIQVNDKSTENLTTTEVADLLKGPKGTQVRVLIAREGSPTPIPFDIIRDEIPRKSVQDGFFLKQGIAYLDIEHFNENTSKEVDENFRRLGEDKIKALILDLRDNPGGLLNEGVAVADRFLQKGQLVVAHRGRATAEKPWITRHGNGGREYPIVVLVNRYSASAAEIVSGALQDHDRAWILGENTFGKGLVQTVYPLNDNTGLALTTARYYTPSGRLIQRDYTNTSFFDYYYRKNLDTKNAMDAKPTDSGRIVYGGGGIAPDEKFESPKASKLQSQVIRKFALFNFSAKYFSNHSTKLSRDWQPDPSVMAEFRDYLVKEGVNFTGEEFEADREWLRNQLRREMFITAFSQDEARRIAVETDPMVLRAIESLPKAKELLENAKKLIVQRQNRR
jgi:carboxyl-terminal processing protease